MMNRRRFLQAVSAHLLAVPLTAEAQQGGKVKRVGVISESSDTDRFLDAFRQGLRELGYAEGQNIVMEYRHTQGALDRVPAFATELVRLKVDVLVVGGAEATRSAMGVARTMPIVFMTAGDPVASGLVTSLARPGGNATGISVLSPELAAKQLELLRTVSPHLSRVAILSNPANPATKRLLNVTREAARTLGVDLHVSEVRQRNEVATALTALATRRSGALLVMPDPVLGSELAPIASFAIENRWPAIYIRREFAEAGGLLAYGPSFADNYRRAASYVDKILKGARPAEIPVEQPTKFELSINLKTAKALGLTVPRSLHMRADQIIE